LGLRTVTHFKTVVHLLTYMECAHMCLCTYVCLYTKRKTQRCTSSSEGNHEGHFTSLQK